MTIFDTTEENQGVFFEMEGGGRIQLRTISFDSFKAIRKQTVKKKIEFKKVDGKMEPCILEEINEDLQNELCWDHIIMSWENFIDGKGNQILCTKENKILLMSRSIKFLKFVGEAIKKLSDSETEAAETAEKN